MKLWKVTWYNGYNGSVISWELLVLFCFALFFRAKSRGLITKLRGISSNGEWGIGSQAASCIFAVQDSLSRAWKLHCTSNPLASHFFRSEWLTPTPHCSLEGKVTKKEIEELNLRVVSFLCFKQVQNGVGRHRWKRNKLASSGEECTLCKGDCTFRFFLSDCFF